MSFNSGFGLLDLVYFQVIIINSWHEDECELYLQNGVMVIPVHRVLVRIK